MDKENLESTIKVYFDMGLLYKDIVRILAIENGVQVSLCLVKHYLRKCSMGRRKNYDNCRCGKLWFKTRYKNPGELHGFRWMYQKCLSNNIHCKKEDVRIIIDVLDPRGKGTKKKTEAIAMNLHLQLIPN